VDAAGHANKDITLARLRSLFDTHDTALPMSGLTLVSTPELPVTLVPALALDYRARDRNDSNVRSTRR
jgi:hypothetical protein